MSRPKDTQPDNTLPTDPAPDNALPGEPGSPDQTLPGDLPAPDQGLPDAPPAVDNTLPPGVDNSLPPEQPGVDNELPEAPPVIDNTLPPVEPVELLALLGEATSIEIVLCDSEPKVIGGIKAVKVEKTAFLPSPAGLKLEGTAIEVQAPPEGAELAGYALIIDKKQVAWADRDPPMTLVANGHYSFAGDVVFPG